MSGSHDDAMRFVQSQTDGLTEFAPGKFVGKIQEESNLEYLRNPEITILQYV